MKRLVEAGLRAPVCLAVHALFSPTAERALRDAGAAQIATTTSVPHPTNAMDVVPLLIPAIRGLGDDRGTARAAADRPRAD